MAAKMKGAVEGLPCIDCGDRFKHLGSMECLTCKERHDDKYKANCAFTERRRKAEAMREASKLRKEYEL